MELVKALGMPFQLASLLFVATTSLLLALVLSVGGTTALIALFAIWLLLIWQTRFAFTLIDDAANGVQETAAASAEMLSPFGDPRCWVHPFLAVLVGGAIFFYPKIPLLPVLGVAVLIFPASIGAIAISGRALDALNPVAMMNVVRGLGGYYALAVLWIGLCAGAGLLVNELDLWNVLRIALLQLLLLLVYAFIGGAVYLRRMDLGFEPRFSPERGEQRAAQERALERQRMIDGLYRDLRVREPERAITAMNQWLAAAAPTDLHHQVFAILAAGAKWGEPRGFSQLLRGMIQQLLVLKQLPLAFAALEAGMKVNHSFTPSAESQTIALISYAQQTGRKRVAVTLLTSFLSSIAGQSEPSAELLALRDRLAGDLSGLNSR